MFQIEQCALRVQTDHRPIDNLAEGTGILECITSLENELKKRYQRVGFLLPNQLSVNITQSQGSRVFQIERSHRFFCTKI